MDKESKTDTKQRIWSNNDNSAFYENITESKFRDIADSAGIHTYCDLELITPYIKRASSILEVGAGYGRVLDYLTNIKYLGDITAIERSQNLYKTLLKQYSSSANIIPGDIITIQLDQQFDLILWLWAGIADFTHQEQSAIVKKLSSLIKPNGYLILDTLNTSTQAMGSVQSNGKQHVINFHGENIYVYGPSVDEIEQHATDADFKIEEHINYTTTTDRDRLLHILKKT